jgi:hypothetical protein
LDQGAVVVVRTVGLLLVFVLALLAIVATRLGVRIGCVALLAAVCVGRAVGAWRREELLERAHEEIDVLLGFAADDRADAADGGRT